MAKKRRKQKEEEEEGYEFVMPEFDEEEYLRKEVRETKTLFITFSFGVIMGVASFGLRFVDLATSILVGLIAVVFLRHIYPIFSINTALLEKKQWATNIIFYLFTWLLIWIILTNPPFSDFQSPNIKQDGIYVSSNGNWTKVEGDVKINYTNNVSFNFTVVDNVGVDKSSVMIEIIYQDNVIVDEPMENIKDDKYLYVLLNVNQGKHEYTISAKDTNGLKEDLKGSFIVE
jgi:hypothetical protein